MLSLCHDFILSARLLTGSWKEAEGCSRPLLTIRENAGLKVRPHWLHNRKRHLFFYTHCSYEAEIHVQLPDPCLMQVSGSSGMFQLT